MSRNKPAATVDEQQLSVWLELTRTAIEQLDPQFAVVQAFWKQGIRSDGRLFAQATPLTVQHSTVNTDAAGSATVRAGNDVLVWATVTLQVGQPAAVAPKQGDVVVSVVSACGSSAPSSSPCSSTNVPWLQSFLQRIAEENVDLEQLVIQEGRLAYRLAVTVTLLAEASRCITTDACVAAVTAALLDTQLPVQPLIQDGVVYLNSNPAEADSKQLNMPILPCSLTAAGVIMSRATTTGEAENNEDFHWIVHPSAEEESSVLSVCTVVIDAATACAGPVLSSSSLSSTFSVLSLDLQTPSTPLATADLAQLMQMAAGHAADMESILRPNSE